jgi:hypothetical protein
METLVELFRLLECGHSVAPVPPGMTRYPRYNILVFANSRRLPECHDPLPLGAKIARTTRGLQVQQN